jgi:hypothetical protein
VLVAGIIGMAGEWRFGQASQSFLGSPRRWRVVAVKAIVYVGVGTLYGTAAALSAAGTAWMWYRSKGLTLPLDSSAVGLTLLGCVAVAAVFGLLGVGVGAIVRKPVPAIVGALAWTAIVEPSLFAAADNLLPADIAAAVLLGVAVVVLALGVRLVERDDVTA